MRCAPRNAARWRAACIASIAARPSRTYAATSSSAVAIAGWWYAIITRGGWRPTWGSWSMPKFPVNGPRSRKSSCEPEPRRHHPRARGRGRAGHAADQALYLVADRRWGAAGLLGRLPHHRGHARRAARLPQSLLFDEFAERAR